MFQDREALTGTEVYSSWKMSVSVTESSCQTLLCTTGDISCQMTATEEKPSQTDQGSSTGRDKKIEDVAIVSFVAEAALMIEDEMESIVLSRAWEAFDGYGLDADDDNKELTLVKHIDIGEGLKVGCLCWSSQDSAVVLSVVEDHSDWCEHGARLETVRVDRRGDLREEEPSLLVTVPSCVTSLQTTPNNTALLAAGCHTGDVFIYRTDREPSEAEVMSSIRQGDTDNLHPVVALLWLSRTNLMSVHSSGLLQLFSFDIRKSKLELKKTFLITATHLPRSLKPLRSGEVGLVHGAVSEDDPNNVIVSTEAGCVIMTDLNSELGLHSMETEKTLYDPVVSVYQLHTGTISAMALSPYDDNILATAGEDLRLLLVAVTSPQRAALSYLLDSPVSSLSWSPTRPSVLAAATNRFVLLFDTIQVMKIFRKIFQTIHHGQLKSGPILKIRHTERTISQPILTCAFPSKDGSRLVSSDKFGRLYFWRLPQQFNSATIQEKNLFQNIPYHSD